MFTYHGWIEIDDENYSRKWESGEIDTSGFRKRILEITDELKKLVDQVIDIPKNDYSVMEGSNGVITIHISGHRNHYSFGPEDLLEWVRINAPCSYGIIHLMDDEHPRLDNEFRVLRLAKNKVTEFEDRFLSPYVGTVE
ncbi:MAG: Imm7 family immunity protein [Bacteroidota bacterium]